jgi:hypothetical protein
MKTRLPIEITPIFIFSLVEHSNCYLSLSFAITTSYDIESEGERAIPRVVDGFSDSFGQGLRAIATGGMSAFGGGGNHQNDSANYRQSGYSTYSSYGDYGYGSYNHYGDGDYAHNETYQEHSGSGSGTLSRLLSDGVARQRRFG